MRGSRHLPWVSLMIWIIAPALALAYPAAEAPDVLQRRGWSVASELVVVTWKLAQTPVWYAASSVRLGLGSGLDVGAHAALLPHGLVGADIRAQVFASDAARVSTTVGVFVAPNSPLGYYELESRVAVAHELVIGLRQRMSTVERARRCKPGCDISRRPRRTKGQALSCSKPRGWREGAPQPSPPRDFSRASLRPGGGPSEGTITLRKSRVTSRTYVAVGAALGSAVYLRRHEKLTR